MRVRVREGEGEGEKERERGRGRERERERERKREREGERLEVLYVAHAAGALDEGTHVNNHVGCAEGEAGEAEGDDMASEGNHMGNQQRAAAAGDQGVMTLLAPVYTRAHSTPASE